MTTKPTKSVPVSPVAVLPAAPVAAPVNQPLSAIHDAAQQAKNLRQVLEEGKQRIGCFLGAGCPLGIYDAADKRSMVLIPAVKQLTGYTKRFRSPDNMGRRIIAKDQLYTYRWMGTEILAYPLGICAAA